MNLFIYYTHEKANLFIDICIPNSKTEIIILKRLKKNRKEIESIIYYINNCWNVIYVIFDGTEMWCIILINF